MSGLPSGGDTTQFDTGEFGVVGPMLSGLVNRTQENVEAQLRASVQSSPAWGSASGVLFQGLDPTLPFPLALLKLIGRTIIGFIPGGNLVLEVADNIGGWLADRWQDLQDVIDDVLDFFFGLVGGFDVDDVIEFIFGIGNNILNVIRSIGARLFGLIPLTSVGDTQPNLLAEPGFDSEVTVSGGGYVWDGEDGKAKPGCARLDCDGEDHVLISNLVPVTEDQKVSVGVYVSYAGVGGTDSIKLELNTYEGDELVSTEPIDAITPSGNSTDWSKKLEGEFTIPEGIDNIALQLHVTSDASSGVVKFDDAWVKKVQPLKMNFVDGLVGAVAGFTSNIQGIIDNIFNAFHNLGEWLSELNPLGSIMDAVLGLLGIGTGAQRGVAQLEARIRALESAANTIVLDFNEPSGNLPSGLYTSLFSGGGGGQMGFNGKGALVWKPSGAGNRTQIARYNGSSLGTDKMLLEWILASTPQSYLFDDAFTYLCARMPADNFTNYLRVRSGYDNIRIQAVVGGSATHLASAWTGYPRAGDHFQWFIGDDDDIRTHVLVRNGIEIMNFTENISVFGEDYRHVGFGMETGNRLVIFQNIPAGLAVFTAAEVL